MKIQYHPAFLKNLKKLDVKIRKSFRKRITVFLKNPYDSELNNHELKDEYQGYRSIDITADYRAIYEEINEDGKFITYFFLIGTHEQLYDKTLNKN
ncbi:MAG: type II toxin-antitoxin system mRNA interferase toxin, RelE/StbE family [Candidatus Levyibacteriota bacterium]|nr:MAG: type II toxin-antitoxin system mRNA interferase toxin, RelE/StbE family [Candidatus Levybacteria bacterium]